MGLSLTHILILILVIVLLFGAGKIPRLMGDMAKGVKAFKKGLQDDEGEEGAKPGRETPKPAALEDGKTIDVTPVTTSARKEETTPTDQK